MLKLFLSLTLLLGTVSCARTVRDPSALAKQLVFDFSVAGKLALNNERITYYIILNAPSEANAEIDPGTRGPRVNGPSLNDTPDFLAGRLPFVGALPGDINSEWTDFFYITGTPDGKGTVGQGKLLEGAVPQIIERNYADNNWNKISDSTLQIRILFSSLSSRASVPKNFTVNLASGDSLDFGQGFVYDWWRSNIPFSVETDTINSEVEDIDPNPELVMRLIPGKPLPTLPAGVNPADVNITSYKYKIVD